MIELADLARLRFCDATEHDAFAVRMDGPDPVRVGATQKQSKPGTVPPYVLVLDRASGQEVL
jgi:hypothetical protein